jgi:hypothetical protein
VEIDTIERQIFGFESAALGKYVQHPLGRIRPTSVIELLTGPEGPGNTGSLYVLAAY